MHALHILTTYMYSTAYLMLIRVVFPTAIRSGDYYMFDDLDDEDIDLEPVPDKREDEDEDKLKRQGSKKFTVGEVRITLNSSTRVSNDSGVPGRLKDA